VDAKEMLDKIINTEVEALYIKTKFPKGVEQLVKDQYKMWLESSVRCRVFKEYPDLVKNALQELMEKAL